MKKISDAIKDFAQKYNAREEQQESSNESMERNRIENIRAELDDVIWDKTNATNPQLRHPETARAIIERFHIASIERSRADWTFIQYKPETGFWERVLHGEVDRLIAELVGSKCTQSMLRSVATFIRAFAAVSTEKLDAEHHLINLNNCAFDLEKYEPVEHSRDHYFTHKTIYDYNREATCPVFNQTLEKFSLRDPHWIDLFWEIIGYCLTHGYEYQYIFWWPGRAGNGKGTVIRVLSKLIGSVFTKPDFNMKRLSDRFFKNTLVNKRCAICGDMPAELVNVHILKQLSGGDTQSTDTKFGDEKNFEPTAKLLFAMNKFPAIPTGEPLAPILRRIVLLPFDYRITEQNPDIEKQFEAELPGIFNKAIEGLQRLRRNKGQFTRCKRGEHALSRWAGSLNSFRVFIQDMCVVEPENTGIGMFLFELYYHYKEYMEVHASPNWIHLPDAIKTTQQLGQELSEQLHLKSEPHYYSSSVQQQTFMHGGRNVRGRYPKYFGIRLKGESDWKQEKDSTEPITPQTESCDDATLFS